VRGLEVLDGFRVVSTALAENGDVLLRGTAPTLEESEGWIWLWLSKTEAVTAVVEEVSDHALLRLYSSDVHVEIRVGDELRWHGAYWDAAHIRMILRGDWRREVFVPRDARHFELKGVHGWGPIEAELPEGAKDLGVVTNGWDHEHCEICRQTIGVGGVDFGFVDSLDHWLCQGCHERWAREPDLGFVVGDA